MSKVISLTNNLLHTFKHHYVDAYSLQLHLKQHPEAKRLIGCLPIDWLKNFPKDEFSKVTKEVDLAFSEFSTNNLDRERCCDGQMAYYLDKGLEKTLKKILRRNDVEVEMIGCGSYKCCRKLTVGDYSYALSTFFHDNVKLYNGDTPLPLHGPKIEPQAQFFAYKNYSQGRIAKPFIAKYGTENNFDGSYILMQYINDKNKPRAKKELNILRDDICNIWHEDASKENKINGIFVDIGGINLNPSPIDGKLKNNLLILFDRIYYEFQKHKKVDLTSLLDANSCFESVYLDKAEKFLIEQMRKGVDIYSADLRQLLEPLNKPKEKKAAIQMVRRMRQMHKLLMKIKAEGELEKYLPYLDRNRYYQKDIIRAEIDSIAKQTTF